MADKEYRVNVYSNESYETVIARVRYNQDLDRWDGRNYTCGSTGRHLGITKLKTGEYVLIHGTQWQGERDTAVIVDPMTALQEILKSGNEELLETKKFIDLKKLAEEKGMIGETEDED
jgi:hypothetical protein